MRTRELLRSLQDNSISLDAVRGILEDSESKNLQNLRFSFQVTSIEKVDGKHKGLKARYREDYEITFLNATSSDDEHRMNAKFVLYFRPFRFDTAVYKLTGYGTICATFDVNYNYYFYVMQDYLYMYITRTLSSNKDFREHILGDGEFPEHLQELKPNSDTWEVFETRKYSGYPYHNESDEARVETFDQYSFLDEHRSSEK